MNKQKWLIAAVLISALFGILGLAMVFWSHFQNEESELNSVHSYDNLNPHSNNDTLIFASVLFIHGNNTNIFPNFQLHNVGKREMFETGQFLRRRYNHLLNGLGYSCDKISIISSNTERAIESAQAAMAGLFPPMKDMKWSNEFLWQPVPIHTTIEGADDFFTASRPCPKHEALFDYYMKESPEALEILSKYEDQIPLWEQEVGCEMSSIDDVAAYYRMVLDKKVEGVLDEADYELLENLRDVYQIAYRLRGTPEYVRLWSGFLIKSILEHSAAKINSTLVPDRVLYLYSGHSSNLLPIMYPLGLTKIVEPPYSSSVHFEVYKNANNEHYLQLFYRKPGEEYPAPFYVQGCGEKWTLEQFYSAHGDIIPGDFDLECQI